MKIVGFEIRTSNAKEFDDAVAKIGAMVQRYHQDQLATQISKRANPGVTFCIYTDYESDHHGDYIFMIGEEVKDFENLPDGARALTLPSAKYQKFTTEIGKMPEVLISAWQRIWQMPEKELGGKRAYTIDFEVHDERVHDQNHASIDIYIALK